MAKKVKASVRNAKDGGARKAPPNIKECCMTCVHAPVIKEHKSLYWNPKLADCELTGVTQVACMCVCDKYCYDAGYESKERIYPFEK